MRGDKKANIIALVVLIILILVTENISHAERDKPNYCSEHYCATIPYNVTVVNPKNWRQHTDLIPLDVQRRYMEGSKRELWIFRQEKDLAVAVEYRDGRVRIDHPDSYCDAITEKLNEELTDCGHVFKYKPIRGLQTISFKGSGALSFIRIFMPLNGGSVYFVCAGRWDNEKIARETYNRVRTIVGSMIIRRKRHGKDG